MVDGVLFKDFSQPFIPFFRVLICMLLFSRPVVNVLPILFELAGLSSPFYLAVFLFQRSVNSESALFGFWRLLFAISVVPHSVENLFHLPPLFFFFFSLLPPWFCFSDSRSLVIEDGRSLLYFLHQ